MNGKSSAGDVEASELLAVWRAAERNAAAAREAAARCDRSFAAGDSLEWGVRAARTASVGATAVAERADQVSADGRSAARPATEGRLPASGDRDDLEPIMSVAEAEAAEAAAKAAYLAVQERLFAERNVDTMSAGVRVAEPRRLA